MDQQSTAEVRERLHDLRGRAGERVTRLTTGARTRADGLVDAIDRMRIPERAEDHPLAALGVALGCGFLLAGQSEGRVVRTAKARLRGLLIAGIIASVRDEAAGLVRDEVTGLLRRGARD